MRPPRALPAAHFDRNESYAYFGDRALARKNQAEAEAARLLRARELLNSRFASV